MSKNERVLLVFFLLNFSRTRIRVPTDPVFFRGMVRFRWKNAPTPITSTINCSSWHGVFYFYRIIIENHDEVTEVLVTKKMFDKNSEFHQYGDAADFSAAPTSPPFQQFRLTRFPTTYSTVYMRGWKINPAFFLCLRCQEQVIITDKFHQSEDKRCTGYPVG
jgi:hypothetical protein